MSEDINVGAISEALNNKMDRDTLNASDTGNINMAGLGMPSNTYIDLTLNASGSTYTAPANGYYYLSKFTQANNEYITMRLLKGTQEYIGANNVQMTAGGNARVLLPVKKGDIVTITYSANGSINIFCFVCAQGSESEAS